MTCVIFVVIAFIMIDAFQRMPVKTCLMFVTLSLCQSLTKGWFLFAHQS